MTEPKKPVETLAHLDRMRLRCRPSVLIVDDDPKLTSFLSALLSQARPAAEGRPATRAWSVTVASTLAQAREAIGQRLFDLQIVDRNLPDGDGVDFVGEQRNAKVRTPIIMLTIRSDLKHRLQGYTRLADHYIGKPFDTDELLAVIAATAWRHDHDGLLTRGKLEIRFKGAGAISYAGRELAQIRNKELCVLALLAMEDPEPVSREMLLEHVWMRTRDRLTGELNDPGTNSIDVTLSRLRMHLKKDGLPAEVIETTPAGWKLDASRLQTGAPGP